MFFKKDLLLIDLETTGLDAQKHEIIQLAAVLLDGHSLREKAFFNSYVKPKFWARRDLESMKINGIQKSWLDKAPKLAAVLKNFTRKFKANKVILSYYGGPVDMDFLRAAFRTVKLPWQFDYHYFNLWALFYGFLAKRNLLTNRRKFSGFTLEDLAKQYRINLNGVRHDGLYDCRLEAEILRKVLKQI